MIKIPEDGDMVLNDSGHIQRWMSGDSISPRIVLKFDQEFKSPRFKSTNTFRPPRLGEHYLIVPDKVMRCTHAVMTYHLILEAIQPDLTMEKIGTHLYVPHFNMKIILVPNGNFVPLSITSSQFVVGHIYSRKFIQQFLLEYVDDTTNN